MRARLLLLALLLAVVAGMASAAPAWAACEKDSIDTLSEAGDLIILMSGQAYDVADADQATAALWQEGEDVLVCRHTIVNKDESGERIKVRPH